jgi:hypothetical protein
MEAGLAAQVALSLGGTTAERVAAMYQALVDHTVADWNLVNGTGGKLPISPAAVREALPWLRGGAEVAGKVIELHSDTVLDPLVPESPPPTTRTTSSSRRGRMAPESTSPTPTSDSSPGEP